MLWESETKLLCSSGWLLIDTVWIHTVTIATSCVAGQPLCLYTVTCLTEKKVMEMSE